MTLAERVHPESSSTGDKPSRVLWRSTRTFQKVLRNSLLSAALAWLFAFYCTVGNIFSGRPPDQQTDEEFLVAKILWFHCFFCTMTMSLFLDLLLTEQLAVFTTRSPLLHWLVKLVRMTSPYFVMVALAVVGGCILLSRLMESSKASVYFTHSCFYVFVSCTDVQTRYLFRTETVRGQVRTRQQFMRQQQRRLSERQSKKPSSPQRRRFFRVLLNDLPLMASALFATAYVHVVSAIKIDRQWDLSLFAVCSISLKLLLQEIAKSFLSKKRRTPNMRTMTITVATPTILVDTQLRTVLLCQDNVSMTVVGSLLLALAEVCFRVAKTSYVQWHVHRIRAKRPQHPTLVVSPDGKSPTKVSRVHVAPIRTTSSMQVIDPIQDRVHRLLSLHAAEIYADMYAEYIAMGCSHGIPFFFSSHPKYQLGNNENSSSRWSKASITGLQLGLEVVVDFVACALEIRRGIDFKHFNQEDAFLAGFMVSVALVNVHISSGIYLRS